MDNSQYDEIKIDTQSPENSAISAQKTVDEEKSRSEFTFRFIVPNFSKLKDEESVLSPPFYIRNLPWKILVIPRTLETKDKQQIRSLGLFLQCNNESKLTTWSCSAVAELRLYSHKENVEPICKKIQHLFYNKASDWGYPHFMKWSDVLESDKEYVKQDCIIVEVHVVADEPHDKITYLPNNEIAQENTKINFIAISNMIANKKKQNEMKKLTILLENEKKRVKQYRKQIKHENSKITNLRRQLYETKEELNKENKRRRKIERKYENIMSTRWNNINKKK